MLITFCVFEMIKYILSEYVFMGKFSGKHRIYAVGIVFYSFIVFLTNLSVGQKNIVAYVVTMVCFFLAMEYGIKERIINTLILFFITVSISGVIQFFYDVFLSGMFSGSQKVFPYLLKDVLCVALVLCCLIVKKTIGDEAKKKIKQLIENNISFGTIFSALIVTFSLSLLAISKEMISDEKYGKMVIAVSGIAYISIGFLGGTALYIKKTNDGMKELMKNEIMLTDIQKKYYEALLDKEKETRAYRHDMSNHLICLTTLAQEGKMDALVKYLDDMQGEIRRIKGKYYHTGNEILDIMTNFYLPQLSDKIKIDIQTNADIYMDERKICTIYSNLLQNAVEELNSQPEKNGELKILIKKHNGLLRMMISNSIFRDYKDGKYTTHKEDKKNHGIGLVNVKTVVEDVGGKMYIDRENNLFTVIVEIADKDKENREM